MDARAASARSTRGWSSSSAAGTRRTTPTPRARCCSTSASERWDEELCELLGVPVGSLPEAARQRRRAYGETTRVRRPRARLRDRRRPAGGALGQGCHAPGLGQEHATAPGSFLLQHAGAGSPLLEQGLITTIAWGIGDRVDYALRVEHVRHRRGRAVAARRARARSSAPTRRGAGGLARGQRRRLLRPRADRPGLTALGPVRARDDRRADRAARSRAGHARPARRSRRSPTRRPTRCTPRTPRWASCSRSCAPTAARPRTAG